VKCCKHRHENREKEKNGGGGGRADETRKPIPTKL
jgi:hypothetical protein